jgi:hypothetical protein
MPMTGVDPLQEFLNSLAGNRKPIPLVATRIDVLIKGGPPATLASRSRIRAMLPPQDWFWRFGRSHFRARRSCG